MLSQVSSMLFKPTASWSVRVPGSPVAGTPTPIHRNEDPLNCGQPLTSSLRETSGDICEGVAL